MGNYTLKYTGEEVDELLTQVSRGGGGGVSSWNDLTDKPFGETTVMGDTITWDGDTSKVLTIDPIGSGQMFLCRVSDIVPAQSDFANGAKLVFDNGNEQNLTASEILPIGNGVLAESNFNFVVVPNANITVTVPFMGMTLTVTFPKKGIYFGMTVGGSRMHSLTINGYTFVTTNIKTIDPKYLPIMRVDITGVDTTDEFITLENIPFTPLCEHFAKGGGVEFVGSMGVGTFKVEYILRAITCSYTENEGDKFVCFTGIDFVNFNIVTIKLTTP